MGLKRYKNQRLNYNLRQLDSLRFLAFLLVFHRPRLNISSHWIQSLYDKFHFGGWVGVDLFFALSAYLITDILLRELDLQGKIRVGFFYLRRALRIWPLYFFTIFLFFSIDGFLMPELAPRFGTPEWKHLGQIYLVPLIFFQQNWAIFVNNFPNRGVISILWTLSVEEQFYLIWPILLLGILALPKAFRKFALLFLIFFPIIIRLVLFEWHVSYNQIYTNTFARFDAFAIGAALPIITRTYPTSKLVKFVFRSEVSIPFASLILLVLLFNPNFTQINNSVFMTFAYSLLAISMGLLVVGIAQLRGGKRNPLYWKPFVHLGKISYGLYVWQIVGILFSESVFPRMKMDLKGWSIVVGVALTVTWILAEISYRLLESPFLKMKQRYSLIVTRI